MSGTAELLVYRSYRLQINKGVSDRFTGPQGHDLLEEQDPVLDGLILWLHQMLVVAARVPRIKGMVANHVQSFVGDRRSVVAQDSVQVFVVAPGHHQVLEATIRLVNSVLGAAINRVN